MLKNVRLIASDLDGTIIRADGTISPRTINAFLKAREHGIHIVFVTGRPFRWLTPIREAFDHLGTVICSNGAVLYDLESEKLIWSKTMDVPTLQKVKNIITAAEPGATFAAETTRGLHLESDFAESHERELISRFEPLNLRSSELFEHGVVKFLAKSRTKNADEFLALVADKLASLVTVTHSAKDVSLLEMAHPLINKSVALADYAKGLGIVSADVAAFGDMPNDLEMLSWAGHGYAMASGHASALEAAAYRAPDVEEDGVAQIIEKILEANKYS
ncbi:haloacid dehalogenase [Arthrobacter sp. MYb227]|uniref:HAD family hydrolase n=1 Tax=Arthrobacter sp. MYb227 TaxID=1848601 RepID=UPI000CFB9B5A|nr:HAD family hydrolase [Arthrobacter sp. MYb227]PQZ90235.1 haloacid dehalogenase [Arthrobacter sp. MYb227]